jgi:hypothetical protein
MSSRIFSPATLGYMTLGQFSTPHDPCQLLSSTFSSLFCPTPKTSQTLVDTTKDQDHAQTNFLLSSPSPVSGSCRGLSNRFTANKQPKNANTTGLTEHDHLDCPHDSITRASCYLIPRDTSTIQYPVYRTAKRVR